MNMNEAFPSKYLRAGDLQERTVDVEISRVEMEKLNNESKPILYFVGKTKGVVLNKTNGRVIANAYGDDTDDWHGRIITLYPTETDYNGERVPCIRVRIPKAVARAAVAAPVAVPARPAPTTNGGAVPIDDQIPFAPEWRG